MRIEAPLAEVLDWLFRTLAPASIDAKARELLLDTFGCAIAARRHPEVRAFGTSLQAADPGSAASSAAEFAAAACWDEACEGLARAHGRPGLSVLAACNALAGIKPHSYQDIVSAYIVGYEVAGRIGETLRVGPGMHVDGAWPCFGVAAAVVRLLGGTSAQALVAVRIAACQMPYSLYLPVAAGANARNSYVSHAAQLGMLAATAALAGVVAPEGALEELHRRALANAQPGPPLAPPGDWLIAEAYLKLYAAVRHVHYGAAAAIALRPEIADRLEDISSIRLATYAEALAYCSNRAPKRLIQAQFSLSYGVACALVTGDLGPGSYDFNSEAIRKLEAKVELSEKPGLNRREATLLLEIEGKKFERTVASVPGDPSLPMTRAELLAKFSRYSGMDPSAGERLLDASGERRFSEIRPA